MYTVQQETAEKLGGIFVIGCLGVAAVSLAWPRVSPLFTAILKYSEQWHFSVSSTEQEPLIQKAHHRSLTSEHEVVLLSLNAQEIKKEISNKTPFFFTVSANMMTSLKILGLNVSLGETVDSKTLLTCYRKKLRESHPDKTHTDSSAYFIEVRTALQTILHEISASTMTSAENKVNGFVFEFALNELFSIFITQNTAMRETISQELWHWQSLRKHSNKTLDAHLQKQDQLIKTQETHLAQQQNYFNQGTAYCNSIDNLTQRTDNLTAEKLAIQNVLNAYNQGQLSIKQVATLFRKAALVGGFTKLTHHDAQTTNMHSIFSDSLSGSSEKKRKDIEVGKVSSDAPYEVVFR
jgi:hypothetical protein